MKKTIRNLLICGMTVMMAGAALCFKLTGDVSAEEIKYEDVEQFPSSYHEGLYEIKKKHPNWTFEMFDTGLEWNTVVYNQMNPASRSLLPSYFPSDMVSEPYGNGWSIATEKAVVYYLDPRNWFTEDYIFQFEVLTYREDKHGIATVQKVVANTFMSGLIEGYEDLTYAQAFHDIGAYLGVSPVHLASRVYQEQGSRGNSPLISGTYPGYEGYYNYFNIQASGTTAEEIYENGMKEAKAEGWNSRYAALLGGSKKLASNYILKGQDTLYLQKFDVDDTYYGMYWHQYMQNLAAPSNESYKMKRAYDTIGFLDSSFVFKIPVYRNMPTLNGLNLSRDGNWYYYKDGEIDTSFTGMASNDYGWWYVTEGKVDFTYTGMALNEYGWWYMVNGALDLTFTGIGENEYGGWYFNNGFIDLTYTGPVMHDGTGYYVTDGVVDKAFSGLVCADDTWVYIKEGVQDKEYTGMALNEYGWWYLDTGCIDFTFTGIAENEYGRWLFRGGLIDFAAEGFVTIEEDVYAVVGGLVDESVNGLFCVDDRWIYVKDGARDKKYTGMASNEYGWWYMTDGELDLEFTGTAKNELGTWLYENGTIKFDVYGLHKAAGIWYYLCGGLLDESYDGMKLAEDVWLYFEDGVQTDYTGIAENEYGWWYFTDGQIDWTFTGTVETPEGIWDFVNGAGTKREP